MKGLAILLSLLLVVSTFFSAQAQPYNLADTMKCVCRIRSTKAYGSATVFSESENFYYVLTNQHVVKGEDLVWVDFFDNNGTHKTRVVGELIWDYINPYKLDLAIVRIRKTWFTEDYKPLVIKLAKCDVKKGDTIFSMGFPGGRWPMAWVGTILSDDDPKILHFHPTPIGGQSGSGIFQVRNGETHLVAIIGYRTAQYDVGNDGKLMGYGFAVKVCSLYKLLESSETKNQEFKYGSEL